MTRRRWASIAIVLGVLVGGATVFTLASAIHESDREQATAWEQRARPVLVEGAALRAQIGDQAALVEGAVGSDRAELRAMEDAAKRDLERARSLRARLDRLQPPAVLAQPGAMYRAWLEQIQEAALHLARYAASADAQSGDQISIATGEADLIKTRADELMREIHTALKLPPWNL